VRPKNVTAFSFTSTTRPVSASITTIASVACSTRVRYRSSLARSSASRRRASVTSRSALTLPMRRPESSLNGVAVMSAIHGVPSLRTNSHSQRKTSPRTIAALIRGPSRS